MSTLNSQFYVVGGTVNPDSPSYVVRRADQELYDRLLAGEFCYVLTSRQMGKSSLMARTARRLREEAHIHTAIVDLTQIGTERDKLSAEQWYYGIAHRILRELKLRDVNLGEWWQQRAQLPALQRLTEFFRDLLLEQIEGQIVVFIDEIDSTISLPFTDDFFAAIRACHNARATDSAYNRLSFVLLGVASPSDLVKDATRTPFNVGQRIELTDFTAEEAKPLAAGLIANGQDGEQILTRILDWTGGHPYLTQKICGAMQSPNGEAGASANVDSLVEQNFLSQTASRDDSNLNFVRDWMKGDKKLGVKVFKLYRNVRRGKPITDAPRSPVQNHLKLSGVVTLRPDKTLCIRNRIYEQVFTDQWAKKATPVDWNRRLAIASAAMLLLSIGFWYGVLKPRQYIGPIQTALNDYPDRYYDALHRYPWYVGKANELIAQFWERRALHDEGEGRDEALLERLQALVSKPTELRRKEVSLLIGNDYQNLIFTLRHGADVSAVAYSPDGKRVLTGSLDKMARQWDAQTGQPMGEALRHGAEVHAVAYSPDGKRVLTGSRDGTARQWDAQTGQPLGEALRHGDSVSAVAYSPDGKRVLTGSYDGTARQWDAQTRQLLGETLRHGAEVHTVAYSPDGKRVLTGSRDGTARQWDAQAGQPLGDPPPYILAVAYSPDGKRVLTGSRDKTAQQWDAQTGQPLGEPLRHDNSVSAVVYSPDGKRALTLTLSRDEVVRQWEMQTGRRISTFAFHDGVIFAVAYSSDATRVLTGSQEGLVSQWDAQTGQSLDVLIDHDSSVTAVTYDPKGNYVLAGSANGMLRQWDAQTGQPLGEPLRQGNIVSAVAYSPDGRHVLSQTGQWFHWSEVTENGLTPKSSRFFSQLWPTGYRFLDADGSRIQAIVPSGANGWQNVTIRFDMPEAPPLLGDPATLLQDWLRRLGLKFDPGQNYKLVPLYPVETSRTASSPFN